MIEPFTLFTFADSLRRSQPVAPAIARSALCQARNTKKCDMLQELSARPLLLQIIEGKLGYFCLRMHPAALFEHWQELLYFDVQSLSRDIASRMRLRDGSVMLLSFAKFPGDQCV